MLDSLFVSDLRHLGSCFGNRPSGRLPSFSPQPVVVGHSQGIDSVGRVHRLLELPLHFLALGLRHLQRLLHLGELGLKRLVLLEELLDLRF